MANRRRIVRPNSLEDRRAATGLINVARECEPESSASGSKCQQHNAKLCEPGRLSGCEVRPGTRRAGALNGTPLGQCLLGVARGIDFGKQTEAVSFTIPITARRVK
jgi:hypothetical protein